MKCLDCENVMEEGWYKRANHQLGCPVPRMRAKNARPEPDTLSGGVVFDFEADTMKARRDE